MKPEIIEQLRVIDEAHSKLLNMRLSCAHANVAAVWSTPTQNPIGSDRVCNDCGRFFVDAMPK